jgi:hypothetical protein
MAAKWQGEPKQWRVRGRSTDGLTVTLGNHETETQAQLDAEKLRKARFYREVTVERIIPPADPQQQGA